MKELLTGAIGVGGWSIADKDSATTITIIDKAGRKVAGVPRREDDLDIARLLAEAPELAALLEDFVKRGDELYKGSGWPGILQPTLGPARALLARIKGEA